MKKSRDDLENVLNCGTHVIGAVVCWSLNGYCAPRDAFHDALTKAWPDAEAALAKPPSARGALRSAVDRMGKRSGVLFRPMASGFAMVLESEASGKLHYQHVATVTPLESGLQFTEVDGQGNELAKPVFARLCEEWQKRRDNVDSEELSDTLSLLLNGTWRRPLLAAFSLRDRTGGVYFVPGSTLPHLLAVKAAIEGLSPGCRIGVLTVSGTRENLVEAAEEARKSLTRQLAEVRTEAQAFIAELRANGKSARDQNLRTRSERFNGLSARVDLFREILGDIANDLSSNIEQARVALLEEIESI